MCRVATLPKWNAWHETVFEHTDCVSPVAELWVKCDEIRLIRKSDSPTQLDRALPDTIAKVLCALTRFFSLICIFVLVTYICM